MTEDRTGRRLAAALQAQADASADRPRPELDELARSAHAVPLTPPAPQRDTGRGRRIAVIGTSIAGVAAVAAAVVVGIGVSGDHPTRPAGDHRPVGLMSGGHPRPTQAPSSRPSTPATPAVIAPQVAGSAEGIRQLDAAAAARARAGDPALQPGQYLLERTADSTITAASPPSAFDRTWRPANPRDTWYRVLPDGTVYEGACDNIYRHTEDPPAAQPCVRDRNGVVVPADLAALPSEPHALYRELRGEAEAQVNPQKVHNVDELTLDDISQLLASDAAPAQLQASLLRAATYVPSLRVIERKRTSLGRTGLGLEAGNGQGGFIVDPKTGEFMGYYGTDTSFEVVDSGPAPAGH